MDEYVWNRDAFIERAVLAMLTVAGRVPSQHWMAQINEWADLIEAAHANN